MIGLYILISFALEYENKALYCNIHKLNEFFILSLKKKQVKLFKKTRNRGRIRNPFHCLRYHWCYRNNFNFFTIFNFF